MKKILAAFLLSFILMNVQAQQEKNIVVDANAEQRIVKEFTKIEVSGAIDLYLSQGSVDAVAISASSDEIKERIHTTVKQGTLQIYFDGKGISWKSWGNHKMKAYVTFKNLQKIEASGACNVKATGSIHQKDLVIEMSGASDFSGIINADWLRLEASGASNIKVSGKSRSVEIEATGACTIKAYDLQSELGKVSASGASNIQITVNKELNANASGGSSIHYKGSGFIRDISSSGAASIKHKTDD